MNKRNSSAGTEADKRTTADTIPSALLAQNGLLGDVHICYAVYGLDLTHPLVRFDNLKDAEAELTNMDDAAVIVTEFSERQKDGSLLIKQQRVLYAPQIWFPVPDFEPEFDGSYLCYLLRKNECGTVTEVQKVVPCHYGAFLCEKNEKITHFMIVKAPK